MAYLDPNSVEPTRPVAERVRDRLGWTARPAEPQPDESDFVRTNLQYFRDQGRTRTFYTDHTGKVEILQVRPTRITTRYSDENTVRAVLDLAVARGWDERGLTLRGAVDFRREAAIQAAVREIPTTGYKLTQMDRQEIAARLGAAVQPVGRTQTRASQVALGQAAGAPVSVAPPVAQTSVAQVPTATNSPEAAPAPDTTPAATSADDVRPQNATDSRKARSESVSTTAARAARRQQTTAAQAKGSVSRDPAVNGQYWDDQAAAGATKDAARSASEKARKSAAPRATV